MNAWRNLYWFFGLLLTGLISPVLAQPPRTESDLNQFLQSLFPVQPTGIDYQAVYDALAQLYSSPLDLNTASRDELSATYLLSERQLNSLLEYRTQYGDLLSVYELQAVPELDVQTIRRLLPFVTIISNPRLLSALPTPTDHYLLLRYEQLLEKQRGFIPAEPAKNGSVAQRYLGSATQLYARYRYNRPRSFSFGFSLEKDPGERLTWNPTTRQYGADFISFHAQLQNRGHWRNLLVGDYQMQIGQGLILSAGFVLGKSAETILTTRRPTLGARPYTSLTEWGYLRGATATYALSTHLDVTLLASRNRRDANLIHAATDEALVTSLQTTGLHRTLSELADRGSLLETNLGAHMLYHSRHGQLGLTLLQTSFDQTIRKQNLSYNEFEFTGRQNRLVGLHGSYVWKNTTFFGEGAHSQGSETHSGGIGAVGGSLISISRRLDIALTGRYYAKNFHSFYANAFSEGSYNRNETGLYLGSKYTIYRRLVLAGFVDRFWFPGWKYLIDAPSQGFDYLLQATYTPNRKTTFAAVYHEEHKEKNRPGSKTSLKEVVGTLRQTVALTADFTVLPGLTLRSRAQWGSFGYARLPASTGFALAQDAQFNRGSWTVSGRVALFGTDDYDSRQYVYERDVLYAFSFPAYYNRGIRHYLLMQYTINRHLDVWVRWARTDLTNQATSGSGLDQIDAPHKSEVKVQARWRF